jgi:hypothetical protein
VVFTSYLSRQRGEQPKVQQNNRLLASQLANKRTRKPARSSTQVTRLQFFSK